MNSRIFLLALLCGTAAGCYGTELESSADGVFLCDVDSECALGSVCAVGVCRDATTLEGPRIRVLEPPALAVYPMAQAGTLPVIVSAEGLLLSNGESNEANAGYIEVLLDGAVVDTITEGDLEDGVSVDSLIIPAAPGLHHLGFVARRLDGEPFIGDSSTVATAFWVDDGKEHVGILSPAPGVKVALESDELAIEIASLNFTFANPGFVGEDEVTQAGTGYVHLYVDAEVPTCIPSCNFDHQSVIVPAGLSRVNRMTAERAVILPGNLGTTKIQIVAQDLLQRPYYREGNATDLVFHQVPVQSVVEVSQ